MADIKEHTPVKSLYEPNGLQLNEAGLEASKMFETAIQDIYLHWLDKGYSPSEIREMLFTQVFYTTTFINAGLA
jgi:hypothetical protein